MSERPSEKPADAPAPAQQGGRAAERLREFLAAREPVEDDAPGAHEGSAEKGECASRDDSSASQDDPGPAGTDTD